MRIGALHLPVIAVMGCPLVLTVLGQWGLRLRVRTLWSAYLLQTREGW